MLINSNDILRFDSINGKRQGSKEQSHRVGKVQNAFLDRFFPLEMIEANILEFINIQNGNMSVRE